MGHGEGHGETHGELDTRAVSYCMLFLVFFTIFAEKGLEKLHHALGDASSVGNQILSKVKNEVMLVGVLSLGLEVAEEMFEMREAAVEAFEWAHTLLFVAALVLVGFAASLIEACAQLTARYHAIEGIALTSLIRRNDKFLSKTKTQTGGPPVGLCDDVIHVGHLKIPWAEAAHYSALRHDFYERVQLPVAFEFSLYLEGALKEFIVELMEVGVSSWCAVIGAVLLNGLRASVVDRLGTVEGWGLGVPLGESDVFLASGWALVGCAWALRTTMGRAWQQLLVNSDCATPTSLGAKMRKARTSRLLAGGADKREATLEASIESRDRVGKG